MDSSEAATLFERHHLALFRYAYRLTRRRDIAEDVVQDVFVRVVRGLEAYRSAGRDGAWLFTILRRLLVDRYRAGTRQPAADVQNPEPAADPTQESSVVLTEALAQLPEADREVFLLREVGGLTYEEIASVCGVTLDAVRSRIYRARVQLRSVLSGDTKATS